MATGTYKTVITTWTPPPGLTKIEQEKAALAYSLEYEKEVKKGPATTVQVDRNITVRDYSAIFLNQIDKHESASYFSSCKLHLVTINSYLGNYRMKDLTPLVIQNFIDMLPTLKYTATRAIPKPKVAAALADKRISINKLSIIAGLSSTTVKNAVRGLVINEESAKKIAAALQCRLETLFDIASETKHYAQETLAKTVSILKHMLSMAKRHLIVDINYARAEYVKGINPEPKEIKCMDLDDAIDTLDALSNEEDIRAVTAVMIGLYMGRRRGEVAGLQWTDIDLDYGEMQLKRARLNVAGRGVIEKRPKSKAAEQIYSMPPTLTEQLKKYKAWWDDYVEKLGDRFDHAKPYLFLQSSGKPIYPTTILYWLKKMEAKYGLKKVHFHSLRHTNISVQYASNQIPSKVIAQRAGHADDNVTKKRYQEIFRKDDKRTAEIVDGIFKRQDSVSH